VFCFDFVWTQGMLAVLVREKARVFAPLKYLLLSQFFIDAERSLLRYTLVNIKQGFKY
jgi:hypothetical protein